MSYKIDVKNSDTSHFGSAGNFYSLEEANKWIEIFKKTSDWDGTKTFNIIDITPPPPTPAEIAVEEAKRVKRAENYQKINDLKGKNLTTPEMKVAVEAILEVLGL